MRKAYIRSLFRCSLVCCILGLCSSCVDEIDVVPKESVRKVSVNCLLHNSDTQTLFLSYNRPVDDGIFFEGVDTTIVATLFEENVRVDTFSQVGYGEWQLKYRPKYGKTYRLEIKIPGEKMISATTTMPFPTRVFRAGTRNRNRKKMLLQYKSVHPLWIFVMGSSLTDLQYFIHNPSVEDDSKAFLINELATNHKDADRFTQTELQDAENTYDSESLTYKRYVRIAPNPAIDYKHPYTFSVSHPSYDGYYFVVLRNASAEYDRYMKSVLEKMQFCEDRSDPARWFDESTIYSNTENALGIFGAYYQLSFYYDDHHNPFDDPNS